MSEEITHQFPQNGFEAILVRLDSLDLRMTNLEEKVERKVMETRPIWEQVTQQLILLDKRFDTVDKRFDDIDLRFELIDQRFEGIDQRFDRIDQRFDAVDKRFDEVDKRFDKLELRLEKVEVGLVAVENRLGKVEREVYHLGKKFRIFEQEILDTQNACEDLDERITKIESPPA
jgi:chromosome segregation ATPase